MTLQAHIYTAAVAIFLTACSGNGDTPDAPAVNPAGPSTETSLHFTVTPDADSDWNQGVARTRSGLYTAQNLSCISLHAVSANQPYFQCLVTKNADGSWTTHDGYSASAAPHTYYWTWSTMDFYAFAEDYNSGGEPYADNGLLHKDNVTWGTADGHYMPTEFTYNVNNGNQGGRRWPVNDLLYAANVGCLIHTDVPDKVTGNTVALNFHHLLSRITFSVINENPTDEVKLAIGCIAFDNIFDAGVYTPKYVSTLKNLSTATGNNKDFNDYGTWAPAYSSVTGVHNCSTYESLGFVTATCNSGSEDRPYILCKPGSATEAYELFLMPQNINNTATPCTNAAKLAVEFGLLSTGRGEQLNADGALIDGVRVAYHHKGLNPTVWKAGHHYNYIIRISRHDFSVELRECPWNYNVKDFEEGNAFTPPMQ